VDHRDLHQDLPRGSGNPKRVEERVDQVKWVLGHLDDLASDLSAIHGIRDMTRLTGPAFFALAYRIGAYQGVILTRAMAHQQQTGAPPAAPGAASGPRRTVAATRTALQNDETMRGLFSFGTMT
jgi:hypothetical protein